ncbi:MAG: DNA recombination protein RmuC, partial [Candidatus Gracilibacteria bacterium]|nr:DNA recombination protein RmuC [Candidatus Gracilibacteria bacterium]
DIGGQLEGLENILKSPKQRGILGEYFLENVLKNILPPENYKLQYEFKNGEKPDAVIFVKEKIIPIDSKFSLENYNRILEAETKSDKQNFEKEFRNDLKKRIDETSKYIRPEEGTMEFAFMFLPSEGIYYDLLVSKVGNVHAADLIEYAFKEKKVIIVSPTSFYAYLQTVMQGLRALQIEEAAKDIQKHVEKLGKHLHAYEVYHEKLGKTLSTTVSHYNETSHKFKLIDKEQESIIL